MNRRRSQPHTAGARRSILLLLTVCLALTTGLAMLGAGAALTDARGAPPRARPAAATAQLVRDFYAAANEAIRTGETAALAAFVAPVP